MEMKVVNEISLQGVTRFNLGQNKRNMILLVIAK